MSKAKRVRDAKLCLHHIQRAIELAARAQLSSAVYKHLADARAKVNNVLRGALRK